jgi:hypothetical protein
MIKNPDWVYFWQSASNVYGAKFVRWNLMRMNTGGADTNKIGVGVVLESDWLWSNPQLSPVISRGCKRGQHILAPYHSLYRTYDEAWNRTGKIRRPSVEEVRELLRQSEVKI